MGRVRYAPSTVSDAAMDRLREFLQRRTAERAAAHAASKAARKRQRAARKRQRR